MGVTSVRKRALVPDFRENGALPFRFARNLRAVCNQTPSLSLSLVERKTKRHGQNLRSMARKKEAQRPRMSFADAAAAPAAAPKAAAAKQARSMPPEAVVRTPGHAREWS